MDAQEAEATRAVSAVLGDGRDLLGAVERVECRWRSDLAAAKSDARALQAGVLREREALREALSRAAALWKALAPQGGSTFTADGKSDAATALRNVAHTLLFLEFIGSAPDAIDEARAMLEDVKDAGIIKVVKGNAAGLFEAHAVLTAVERVRDLALLETLPHLDSTGGVSRWFTGVEDTRELLEELVVDGIFRDLLVVAQTNPRLLVAAGRIVQREQEEDIWWDKYIVSGGHVSAAILVRPFVARKYRSRMADAVAASIVDKFSRFERALGIPRSLEDPAEDVIESQASPPAPPAPPTLVDDVIQWLDKRIVDNETIRRFAVPCLPPSYEIAELYEAEQHRCLMTLIVRLLRSPQPYGGESLGQRDTVKILVWYTKYRLGPGRCQPTTIDSFLRDVDRRRVVYVMQNYVESKVTAHITDSVREDAESASNGQMGVPKAGTESEGDDGNGIQKGLSTTELPEVVFGCIKEHVVGAASLGLIPVNNAVARSVCDALLSFQTQIRHLLKTDNGEPMSIKRPGYACAVANNMARCLEYAESLRDMLLSKVGEGEQGSVEHKFESVIEGFREAALLAIGDLMLSIEMSLNPLVVRFFAPHTGTEIMLDVTATLSDYFRDYEVLLLPYHFERLALECLRHVVVRYLVPFLHLGEVDKRRDAPSGRPIRRIVSLSSARRHELSFPDLMSGESSLRPAPMASRRRSHLNAEEMRGLESMNASAVVAQIDKDIENLTTFLSSKVVLYQRKQLQPALEPLHAIRALYSCSPSQQGLAEAYSEAVWVTSRVLRQEWVGAAGLPTRLTATAAEVIWSCREDVSAVVLGNAMAVARAVPADNAMVPSFDVRTLSFDDAAIRSALSVDSSPNVFGGDSNALFESSSSLLRWLPSSRVFTARRNREKR